jgi:hypothetical protein
MERPESTADVAMFVDGINARCRNAAINTATGNK